MEAVLRLLRGETLDAVSRELGVSGATLGQWRDQFVAGGQGSPDPVMPMSERDAEIQQVARQASARSPWTTSLRERARALEAGRPLAPRRSKP